MEPMLFAAVLFLATHLGLSSTSLRDRLVGSLGERGYLAAYSLLALVTLGYMIWLYGALPRYDYFWLPDPGAYLVPKLVMPLAMILLLGGFMAPNPTAVGMAERLRGADPHSMTRGITRITRHPFQWAVVLWAGSHLIANGDRVSVVMFGAFGLLGLLGGVLIDRKKARQLGSDWQTYARITSNVPFAAILAGHNRLAPREQLAPVAVGLVGYAAVYWAHPFIAGVRLL